MGTCMYRVLVSILINKSTLNSFTMNIGSARQVIILRGLSLEIDEPAGGSSWNRVLRPEDILKDGTGVGQLWEGATNVLCDYLETHPAWLGGAGTVFELGAGIGVPGMLCASLGASSVTLTDYHPLVLSRLQTNLQRNPHITSRCTVEEVAWGSVGAAQHHQLLLGADLAVSERGAAQLAETVLARIAPGGVFIYAHEERRAVMLEHGVVCTEPTDSGLGTLVGALWPLHCRELHSRASADRGCLKLLAFGQAHAVAMLPSWCEAAAADGVKAGSPKRQRCT
jgi:hypothetical protein